uniref:GDP-mannose pyrophosphatase n=1 Tax=Candidatus Kentrum sp. DK TaxID=2126562 RepID=A0A450TKS4_9GAMM|nr:MAG: 8-oxo-dGTPase [Candidatus Kentron sp. DK]
MEKWIDRKEIYQGTVFSVQTGKVELDDGIITHREVVRHRGGVAIVPVLDDSIIFVRQYRIAIERDILEIPAGLMEKGEPPEAAARRELREETGFEAGTLLPGPQCYASCGYTDEKFHLYLALDLKKAVRKLDFDERLEEVILPLEEVERRIAEGEFEDAKTLIGLYTFFRLRGA